METGVMLACKQVSVAIFPSEKSPMLLVRLKGGQEDSREGGVAAESCTPKRGARR